MIEDLNTLIKKEGWELTTVNGEEKIIAYGRLFRKAHPVTVYLKLYRTETNPEQKYNFMKASHDMLWPSTEWHYWTEDRFRAHCEGWSYLVYAGGASCAKSFDAAKIAILFWLANPKHRTVIVASTTLESLNSRIWGYVTRLISKTAIRPPYNFLRSTPPKILYKGTKDEKDTIHGMFAIAAKKGEDETVISSWIGRHPDEGMMLTLDESTDMPGALLKALPNLESGVDVFQCVSIGNSSSQYDLHGALATPEGGWKTVDPMKDKRWKTTQKNGVCLFFSCYESPAIHEVDPEKAKRLGRFLITSEQIKEKEEKFGKDSDSFYRFVLGFWRSTATDNTVISRNFIDEFNVFTKAEWSGLYPLHVVAGLDPAFSTGGDACVLRLAVIGQMTNGQIVLDYRDQELLFNIQIKATTNDSAELQIADQVIKILAKYNVPINTLCIDANGQGRALGEVIRLRARAYAPPIKIYSVKVGHQAVRSFDVVIKTNYELWFAFRDFIQYGQIKGLDITTAQQLTSRLVVSRNNKHTLETKKEFKNRMGAILPSLAHSPDEADAASLALQSAILNYGFVAGQRRDLVKVEGFMHEKYLAFQQLKKIEESHVSKGPPQATFADANLIQGTKSYLN